MVPVPSARRTKARSKLALPRLVARGWSLERGEAGLSALLIAQGLTLFVAVPLSAVQPLGRIVFDVCHLAFAAICITLLTRRWDVRAVLLAGTAAIALGPWLGRWATDELSLPPWDWHQTFAAIAFAFNLLITVLIARRVFAPGRVTAHRLRGGVLLYLNVAALFAIAYGEVLAWVPGAIVAADGHVLAGSIGARMAQLTYFSFTTITTTGYGDLVPVVPLARSLSNLESVFGHLFPATLLARLVALHVAHDGKAED